MARAAISRTGSGLRLGLGELFKVEASPRRQSRSLAGLSTELPGEQNLSPILRIAQDHWPNAAHAIIVAERELLSLVHGVPDQLIGLAWHDGHILSVTFR